MRRLYILLFASAFLWTGLSFALGADFTLTNGEIIKGEPSNFNEEGLVVRLDLGGFSQRIGWPRFSQDTLKELAKNPQIKKFAEPFIEIPIEIKQRERAKKKEIILKEVPKIELPPAKGKFLPALFSTPMGFFVLGVLFLANVLSAVAVAQYRQRPVVLVTIISIIFPFLGPLLFLVIPTAEEIPQDTGETVAPEPVASQIAAPIQKTGVGVPGGGGLGLAAHAKDPKAADAAGTAVKTFKKGDTTFNRRFFETQFPGMFRVVPSEAEKDLVLLVKTAKGEFIVKRISRISMNECHVQTLRGGAEVAIPFGEIMEVQHKHKDAK